VLNKEGYDFQVMVNWLNDMTRENLKEFILEIRSQQGKQVLQNKNPFGLPRRLWDYLLGEVNVAGETRWGELTSSGQNKLMDVLICHTFHVTGKTTFKEEFVTSGGVSLSEVNPETMESRILSGLYFAGEILNVDGITGGFNFQHAWSSSWIAARAILR
jgi:predicted Rossmann fold flavoprotein